MPSHNGESLSLATTQTALPGARTHSENLDYIEVGADEHALGAHHSFDGRYDGGATMSADTRRAARNPDQDPQRVRPERLPYRASRADVPVQDGARMDVVVRPAHDDSPSRAYDAPGFPQHELGMSDHVQDVGEQHTVNGRGGQRQPQGVGLERRRAPVLFQRSPNHRRHGADSEHLATVRPKGLGCQPRAAPDVDDYRAADLLGDPHSPRFRGWGIPDRVVVAPVPSPVAPVCAHART